PRLRKFSPHSLALVSGHFPRFLALSPDLFCPQIGSPPHVRRPRHSDPFLRCIRYPHVAPRAVFINANVSFVL
ncbi:hypothetical protein FB451DRAFT_1087072, partial [Mycena latifolia]